ncbi:MAG: HEAT repeat domain-containing protein [Planctomycetota bacterium]|nr:MAG: HEAT repeat domain-containing protein [Planctomycetota bacterium]
MLLTSLLAALSALAAPAAPQDPAPEPAAEAPEPVDPAEAAARIKEVLKGKDYVVAAATLEELGSIEDKAVVKAVAAGLKSKDKLVKTAAIRALRYNPSSAALDELLKRAKDKSIIEDPELAVEYYYALGQHGDRKAVKVLADDLFSGAKGDKVAKARIAALGHIRHKDSVDELMGYMVSSGGRRRGGGGPRYQQDVRLALIVLTGEDHGTDSVAWLKWWGDHKNRLKISPEEWPLPSAKLQRQWQLLWATPQEKEEARKRLEEKRRQREAGGEDPEKDEDDGGDEDGGR